MPKILTQSQIDTFWRDGCVFPIRVMPNAQALEIRARLEAFEPVRAEDPISCPPM